MPDVDVTENVTSLPICAVMLVGLAYPPLYISADVPSVPLRVYIFAPFSVLCEIVYVTSCTCARAAANPESIRIAAMTVLMKFFFIFLLVLVFYDFHAAKVVEGGILEVGREQKKVGREGIFIVWITGSKR